MSEAAGHADASGPALNVPNGVLQEIVGAGETVHPDGRHFALTSASSIHECEAMYRFLRSEAPAHVIEIGMAYGVSALTILTALEENGQGSLVSIDPYPSWETARACALSAIERAGLSARHEHLHEGSERALPRLLASGASADFVYIDGDHGFDHAFVDFFYADRLIPRGGVIAFDDSRWRSVHKVIRFLQRARAYEEIDVGIPVQRDLISRGVRLLTGRRGPSRYFRKTGDWRAPYNAFFRF